MKVLVRCSNGFCAARPGARFKKAKKGDIFYCPNCGQKWVAVLDWVTV